MGSIVRLSDREQEVVRHLRDGRNYKEIAALLGIAVPTARVLGSRALRKIGRPRLSLVVHGRVRTA